MAALLGKLRYEFLKESLDFVGVHRDRLVEVILNLCAVSLYGNIFRDFKFLGLHLGQRLLIDCP